MKIIHFQRKPVSSRYFSIENSFEAVRREMMKTGLDVEVSVCKYISQGLLPRVYNTLEAAFRQKDINHVTGDVHYINLLFNKKKSILTIHDCVFLQHPSKIAKFVLKLFWLTIPASRCQYITCISESTKKELLNHIHIAEKRIKVIPTVVLKEQFPFSVKPFNRLCPAILQVGTTPNKNLERVAEALNGFSCILHIIGPLSEKQKAVLTYNGIHYSNEVGVTNSRMAEKYKEADIILFTSVYEGFGMPILEGQLTGRPVITSCISPMKEIAGDSALLADPYDTKSIRSAIEKLTEEPELRNQIIIKGKENAKRFSAESVARLYTDLYELMHKT